MIETGDLRKGLTFNLDGRLVKVVDFSHNKQGRGSAQVRMTLRDLRTGSLTTHTVQAGAKFPQVRLDRQHVQYLYADGDQHHFMDTENYEQLTLSADDVGELLSFLLPNMMVGIEFHDGKPVGINPPSSVDLAVVDTEPSMKGATASASYKPAKLETGVTVQVPPFVQIGDKVRVDPSDGSYLERVK